MACNHLTERNTDRFALKRFTVTMEDAMMGNLRMIRDGHSHRIVRPGTYIKLVESGHRLWMSDTHAERYDHLEPLVEMWKRGGTVLIFGLGIGMIVHAALQLQDVERVIVVEKELDVIALIEPQIKHPKLTVLHADAMKMRPGDLVQILGEGYRLSVFYADIWEDLSTDNLPIYGNLKRRWSKVSDYRHCWAENDLRREKRRETRY